MKSLFVLLFVFVAVLIPTSAYAITITYPKVDNLPAGSGSIKGFGSTSEDNSTLTKYLQLWNVDHVSLIAVGNKSLANGNILVSVSNDNTTFVQIDSVAEGSGSSKGILYSDAIKATSVAINPALFPYLRIVVPPPVNGTITLYWSSGNEAAIS